MIENQQRLVNEIVKRIESTPYLMYLIPPYEREQWLSDLNLIVLVGVASYDSHLAEEETLS